ncbi:MAG: VWA domain-containing protein [Lachnospiraceae bacterium]|nr:VWA domain-containing protein [Lachnospiraceae bacterium]
MAGYNTSMMNTSKRLPIVFCLDVSPSMGWNTGFGSSSSMDLLNTAVRNFIEEIKADPKARACAEVSFVTFSSDVEMSTNFESVSTMKVPRFQAVREGGTQMALAVMRAINKIEARREQLEDLEIPYYAPFLVIVTDGNPDQNDNQETAEIALKMIRSHCASDIGANEVIVPFVIGVGNIENSRTLREYVSGFSDGYFPINGKASAANTQFKKVFQMIGDSTKKSVHLNGTGKEIIETLKSDMNDLLRDLQGIG